ncbi:MAG: D-alanyl-D-alanine carboxypeptidase [Desulfobacteraceae bacterium]|nr:D-alanyl-D-alanine carboxypeptidase [Desulfobacteraceae bacterium]
MISAEDALLVADPDGRILHKKNEEKKCVPASTLKILTSLAAIHQLGKSHRFETHFFLDNKNNLKVKGFGDPLLISEALPKIADVLAFKLKRGCKYLIIDDTYFIRDLDIPGVSRSANPYDAPNGAFCANFNTVYFKRDKKGDILSAEPQTPMVPFAVNKIKSLGLKRGRYTFSHNSHDAAIYAGELLLYFLKQKSVDCQGKIQTGAVTSEDRLLYIYKSEFTLEEVLKQLLEFSNNFVANQLLIALGASVYDPPGTLDKGVRYLSYYAREILHLKDIQIVEGSGISRQNKISALDMLAILKAFKPNRYLLTRKGKVWYKSGTLKGINTRAGYIEGEPGTFFYFVIFLNNSCFNIESVVNSITNTLNNQH